MTNIAKVRSIVLLVSLGISWYLSPAQNRVDTAFVQDEVLGPFIIGKAQTRTVYARVTHVHLGCQVAPEWPDSDTLMIIHDERGEKLLELSSYTTLGAAETQFGCSRIYIPTVGDVLSCTRNVDPVDGIYGQSFQFFGVNSNRQFVPVAAPALGFEYKIVFLDSRTQQRPILVDSSHAYAKVAIEFDYWTGYYSAKVYSRIYPEGYSKSKDRDLFHFDEIPISLDTADINRSRLESEHGAFRIALFTRPSTDSTLAQSVRITDGSTIQYLFASYVRGWWLFASIDGLRGYIAEGDCPLLGFPLTSGSPVMLGDDY